MVLPQGVAFATLAGMPPEYGLYGAMLPAIVGALWGSSWHLVSGPTNATSLMVFATVGALAVPFTPTYVALVLTLNLMVGLMKLGLGLARLGSLVNFISTAVVIGFTAGAGLLIIGAQLRNFFGISVPQEPTFLLGLRDFVTHLHETDPAVLAVGAFTLLAAIAGKRWWPRVPYMLTGIVLGALFAWVLGLLNIAHVQTIGALPSAVPPLSLPDLSLQTWQTLAPIALALMVIGLSEAISSARAVALKSGQRIDGNQEFIGQGLANIVGAFTSSYPTSGSFNRTGANYEAGARTPLACVFSAILLLVILLLVRPLAGYLPVASMAAVLFIVAWGLIDIAAMRRVWRTSRADALTLAVTFIATLTIRLEVAILVGVLVSLLIYLNWATHPQVLRVVPDPRRATPLPLGARRCAALPATRHPAHRRCAVLRLGGTHPRRDRGGARVAAGDAPPAADRQRPQPDRQRRRRTARLPCAFAARLRRHALSMPAATVGARAARPRWRARCRRPRPRVRDEGSGDRVDLPEARCREMRGVHGSHLCRMPGDAARRQHARHAAARTHARAPELRPKQWKLRSSAPASED